MRDFVIRTENLTKFHGQERWIENLTLDVEPGEVFGFLGPQGAGKSTFIRILMNYLHPTRGDAYVLGMDIRRRALAIRRRIGYAAQEPQFYPHLSAAQMLQYLGDLNGQTDWVQVKDLASRFNLNLSRTIGAFSSTDLQKLNLIQAWMHRPDLLLLDEPYRNLDEAAKTVLNQLIVDSRNDGHTVFLATQNQAIVERLGDRVGIIQSGCLLSIERVIQFKARQLRKMEIRFAEQVPLEAFSSIPNLQDLTMDRLVLRCTVKGDPDRLIKTAGQFRVIDLICTGSNVEEFFQAYYKDAPYAA